MMAWRPTRFDDFTFFLCPECGNRGWSPGSRTKFCDDDEVAESRYRSSILMENPMVIGITRFSIDSTGRDSIAAPTIDPTRAAQDSRRIELRVS